MKKVPVLAVGRGPPAPTDDMNASTFGSWARIAATAHWRWPMAAKEASWAPSVKAVIWPVSPLGRKSLGTALNSVTVAATVNGKKITQELLDTFTQAVAGNSPEPVTDEQKAQMLDQLINMTLAAQAAEKDGLQKDPKVSARLDLLRTQILAEAASEKFIKANTITDADLKAEYDTQVAGMPKEYKARHILVEKQETADSIIRELQAGGDFSKIAVKESKDSSGKAGGDLDKSPALEAHLPG